MDKDGNIASVEWGPKDDDVPTCLATACDVLIRSWRAVDQLFHLGVQSTMEEYTKQLVSIQHDS